MKMVLPLTPYLMPGSTIFRGFCNPLRLKVYPNGEFSATRIKECATLVSDADAGGFDEAMRWSGGSYFRGQVSEAFRSKILASALGSSNVSNSHKTPKSRGRRGMTRYNKRLIVNSVLLLERKYGKSHLSFLTLTLPPECASGEAGLYAEAKRQMAQWLQRSLVRCALPPLLIGCTEVQSSRLGNTGEFALHEHWVFVGRRKYSTWALRPKEIAVAWSRILGNVYELECESPVFSASTRIESIRKSASAYLGKYVSKGEKCVQQLIEGGYDEFLPSSWVTKTAEMLAMFRASVVSCVGDSVRVFMELLQDSPSLFCRWRRNLKIEMSSGVEVWLGFIGYLSPEGLRLFDAIFQSD